MDCWTPVCSFVESSSEKDATQRQNNVVYFMVCLSDSKQQQFVAS